MATKATRMEDLDLPTALEGDGKSTVDPYSKHGHFIQPDGKSTVDTSEYIGPDPADSVGGVVEPTSASDVVDPEFQSEQPQEDKPKTTARRGRPPRKTEDKTDEGEK